MDPWYGPAPPFEYKVLEEDDHMGIDAINPMDPSGVDYRQYKKRYGRRATLCGNIDLQWPLATCARRRREVRPLHDSVSIRLRDHDTSECKFAAARELQLLLLDGRGRRRKGTFNGWRLRDQLWSDEHRPDPQVLSHEPTIARFAASGIRACQSIMASRSKT